MLQAAAERELQRGAARRLLSQTTRVRVKSRRHIHLKPLLIDMSRSSCRKTGSRRKTEVVNWLVTIHREVAKGPRCL